ncbi:FAS1-like dehydratase domain-containing protein [Amycolatopsis sp.]|jgi:3-methylfumaryl-CoA hydratase|uniref:FAS1-like dehydratase domain-containing protein n=1 Tax=Amycolatopsis sp. TaxID=37632 RepID=UPI002DF8BA77|nr:MaoC family dehydratase N-terminal domain-containing protein [Amycolatopsis sp.]
MTTDLNAALKDWAPAPVNTTGRIDPRPANAFSALLDLPDTMHSGDPLPPLWHWFYLLDGHRRSELGKDGHPQEGGFLPPIPDRRRMFAGGRLAWHAPILIGDEVTRRSSVRGVVVKDGSSGETAFVTVGHEISHGDRLLVVEEQDIAYRSQPVGQAQGSPRRPASATPAQDPGHDLEIRFATDPVVLFQFSALTFNSHRIHYDHEYVTSVEGYPGLVVHGPLLALLLLEVPRRHRPGERFSSFSYRLSKPAFSGAEIAAGGRWGTNGELELSAGVAGNAPSITGVAARKPSE